MFNERKTLIDSKNLDSRKYADQELQYQLYQ